MGKWKYLFVAAAMTLASCSTAPVQSTVDPQVNMAKYHTFKWVTQADVDTLRLENPNFEYLTTSIPVVQRPQVEDRVRPIITDNLVRAGFKEIGTGKPDFYVTFYGKAKDDDWVSSWHGFTQAYAYVPIVMFPNFDRAQTRTFRDGVVYLTIYDANSKKPAWTGSVQSEHLGQSINNPELATMAEQLVNNFKKRA